MTMLIAAHAMGYVANWITEWCAYDARVKQGSGLAAEETSRASLFRKRLGHWKNACADLDKLITYY